MTVDALLYETLTTAFDYLVERTIYTGKEERYITYQFSTVADDFGDDMPGHERYLVLVNLFLPLATNPNPDIRKMKTALLDAGFTWPDTQDMTDENGRHIVFECEIANGVD